MPPDDIEAELVPAETPDSHEAFPRLTADQLELPQAGGSDDPPRSVTSCTGQVSTSATCWWC